MFYSYLYYSSSIRRQVDDTIRIGYYIQLVYTRRYLPTLVSIRLFVYFDYLNYNLTTSVTITQLQLASLLYLQLQYRSLLYRYRVYLGGGRRSNRYSEEGYSYDLATELGIKKPERRTLT